MAFWSDKASANLEALHSYIARRSPKTARKWTDALVLEAERASLTPGAGRMVPEIGRRDVREVFLKEYRIIFRVMDDGIRVLAVVHGRRLLPHIDLDA